MKTGIFRALVASFWLLCCCSQAVLAEEPARPYQVALWADVQFGADGKPTKVDFIDAGQWPAPFLKHVEEKLGAQGLASPRGGEFETGVLVQVEIRPGTSGSSAAVLAIRDMPRPLKGERGNPLRMKVKGEWSGSFLVRCRVGVNGRCAKPELDASANVPAEMEKLIRGIANGWRFAPPKLAGSPVEGDYETMVEVEADTSAPPRTFDKSI